MKIYSFTATAGHSITEYGSQGVALTPVLGAAMLDYLACFYLEPHGVIGIHEAANRQLLLIISGDAVVGGGETAAAAIAVQPVYPGDAVLWQPGEWHETRAGANGLTAMVLEGDAIDQAGALRLRPKGG
jgi:quercetin dioxygenase-like cupin family protein